MFDSLTIPESRPILWLKDFTLTRETISSFEPGTARLRSVATGRPQWMRLPPPTVREIEVQIQEN